MEKLVDFRLRLAMEQEKKGTLLCVGLDPDIKLMPDHLKSNMTYLSDEAKAMIVVDWMINIIDATAPFACMYKPQIAHWEALGTTGIDSLEVVVRYIKTNYPSILVFLDCKRGDIDNTQEKYRIACFEKYGVDGMNFNPYMGKSCMKALYDEKHPGRSLVGLCFTSNPDARQTQNVKLGNGDLYWEFIAKCILEWAEELGPGVLNNAGLVMAAAYNDKENPSIIHKKHLRICREIVRDNLWFLIPGIGIQGGLLEETIIHSCVGWGSVAINESRSIIFASKGEDFAQAATLAAEKSRDIMRKSIDLLNKAKAL